ncbi:DNA-binding response regulator [Acidihalobacter ferrooxydans]|uniref:DNA-binding response regulator n=2 Tax=Acidihalobacter ferrooxydans TaxID=1765967 RepID=A0A1P8UL61_9GAMM|nr:response regulator transcription factor [Acidihalobacter ferrooxydans]APZ44542.1 DNA-binding response regulator [Acidihalobacter ferrooxydans]
MRILLIEDDAETAAYVTRGFSEQGHVCDALDDGRQGLTQALAGGYDVIVVDRMLPRLDGLSLVRALRSAQVATPVIYLTAIGEVDERVAGLEAGGDDYLVKPFAFSELAARVQALARRAPGIVEEAVLRVADLELDRLRHRVTRAGQPIDLQAREFRLLEYLMRNAGRIVTRTMLLEQVWELRFDPKTSVVETHISRLRGKIDKPFATPLLHTERNLGYTLRAPD